MGEKQLKKRSEIPVECTWKLDDIFPNESQWEEECKKALKIAEKIAAMQGTLGKSAANLLSYMKKNDEVTYYLMRVLVYSNEMYNSDTAVAKYQAMSAKASSVIVKVTSASSFANPEILAIPAETIEQFYKDEPDLLFYKRAIDVILREKEHILSEQEESILAQVRELAGAPADIFTMFNNADIKFPSLTDVEGNRIQLTHGNYISFLESKDRSLRKQAFEGMYDTFGKMGNTIATTFVSHLKQDRFYAKVRKYPSDRAMYLSDGNIPESVYDNLIETVHKHLPALHEYVALRKKVLDVEHLHMYDLFTPLVEDVEMKYTFEEAKDLAMKALAPMGEEYLSILREGFENRWIDVYENENKRSGAHSWACYGTHPYVMLNHMQNLDSAFTLVHEMGHAIHSYYSNKNQKITYAEYLIFVAEVASTCNEELLTQYLLKTETDPSRLAYILTHSLEDIRGTIFRQTMFAEFEKIVHAKITAGEELTQEDLNKIYYDLNVMYFGPEMTVDEAIAKEWMRIPHFYTSFYVYQYATGLSAAIAFANKILKEGKPAVDRYVTEFLSGGCSKDPIDLLKAAGVDMSTPDPIDSALNVFEEYLELLKKQLEK